MAGSRGIYQSGITITLTTTERAEVIAYINGLDRRAGRNGPKIKEEDVDFMLSQIRKENQRKQAMFARRLQSGPFIGMKYLYNLYFKNL